MTAFFSGDVWNVALAVLTSLGGGGVIVFALSSWLGKVWAGRFIEKEKAKYQSDLAELKATLDKQIHAHNVAATRIDGQRVDAIRDLYGALIGWHEAAINIAASNKLDKQSAVYAIGQYTSWAAELVRRAEHLDIRAMHTAIFFSEETYQLIARCGMSGSLMSIDFMGVIRNFKPPNSDLHLQAVEAARETLRGKFEADYQPARRAVITEFRRLIDPRSVG